MGLVFGLVWSFWNVETSGNDVLHEYTFANRRFLRKGRKKTA